LITQKIMKQDTYNVIFSFGAIVLLLSSGSIIYAYTESAHLADENQALVSESEQAVIIADTNSTPSLSVGGQEEPTPVLPVLIATATDVVPPKKVILGTKPKVTAVNESPAAIAKFQADLKASQDALDAKLAAEKAEQAEAVRQAKLAAERASEKAAAAKQLARKSRRSRAS
jgi:hypothetical protein